MLFKYSNKVAIVIMMINVSCAFSLPYGYKTETHPSAQAALEKSESNRPIKVSYARTVDIKADGSGDFKCLKEAFEAVGSGPSASLRNLFKVHEGVYEEVNTWIPNNSDVIGIGKRDNIWIKGEMPESVDPDKQLRYQTLWMNDTSMISNLKITAKNMRYPLHSDSGTSNKKALQEIYNCYIEHLGNDESFAYQKRIGSGQKGWISTSAAGIGTHSGERIIVRDSTFVSPTGAFGWHNNRDFKEPCIVEVYDSKFICTRQDGGTLSCRSLGSGTDDMFIIKNCDVRGQIYIGSDVWLSDNMKNQPGNRLDEIYVYMSGCNAVPYRSQNYARILELRSAPGANSDVKVSGSAAGILFGDSPDVRDGCANYAGRIYSCLDISGKLSKAADKVQLGARLGNCSAANKKYLEIIFDGKHKKSIELDKDYSACSNEDIVKELNEKLGDKSRAFFISNPYNLIPPFYDVDHQKTVINNGAEVIYMGMAVACDKNGKIRPMRNSDDASTFIGIALDDFFSGQKGRIQHSGRLFTLNLKLTGSKSFKMGEQLSVSGTAGVLVKGDTKPVMKIADFRRKLPIAEINR